MVRVKPEAFLYAKVSSCPCVESKNASQYIVFTINQKNKMEGIADLRERYKKTYAWGLATQLDLHACNSTTIRDAEKIKQFVHELCDLIDMKRFGETVVVNFGEDPRVSGFSMTQLIETSLISGHFANQSNNVYLDVFSCKFYDPHVVAEFAKKFFEANEYNVSWILRK